MTLLIHTGFTTNIINRLKAHRDKEVRYTKDKLPLELVHITYFKNKQKAYDFKRYLKVQEKLLEINDLFERVKRISPIPQLRIAYYFIAYLPTK